MLFPTASSSEAKITIFSDFDFSGSRTVGAKNGIFSDFSPRPAESALFRGQSTSVLANFEVLKRFKRVSEVTKAFFEVKRPKVVFTV